MVSNHGNRQCATYLQVSVNFFSAYTMYSVQNQTNPANFYSWYGDNTGRYAKRYAHFTSIASDPTYNAYQALCDDAGLFLDSFLQVHPTGSHRLALTSVAALPVCRGGLLNFRCTRTPPVQVIEDTKLGFKLIKDTIASYQSVTDSSLVADDSSKIQTWVIQQSKTANLNLAPYYRNWGWPLTNVTLTSLANLPLYTIMPSPPPSPPAPPPPSPPPAPPIALPPMTLADYQQLAAGTGGLNTAPYYMSGHYLHGQAMALAVPPGGTAPLISANKYGNGRLLHAGHEGILYNTILATSGLGALMKNAALWASSNKAAGIRVAGSESGLTTSLVQQLADSVRCVHVYFCLW